MIILPNNKKVNEIKYEDKTISRVFYENKLIYGKPLHEPEYTPVTAIVASNKEQWVDTGLGKGWWTNKITFETKAMFSEASAAAFGQRAADKMFNYDLIYANDKNYKIQCRIRNNDVDSRLQSDSTLKLNTPISMSLLSESEFYVDNKKCATSTWNENRIFILQDNFHLFRINQYCDNSMSYNDEGTRTIYYIKMWYNNKLVMDYIPVLDKDGIPCFFDKVT